MTIEREGLFDISVTKILKEALLQPEAIFQCLLTIPETTFIRREETMYFPGKGKPEFQPQELIKNHQTFHLKKINLYFFCHFRLFSFQETEFRQVKLN